MYILPVGQKLTTKIMSGTQYLHSTITWIITLVERVWQDESPLLFMVETEAQCLEMS